jgi:Zn-dependent protease/CBS domain-containing protein
VKGSLRIGRFAGINVYIHWTFLLLIGYVLFYFGAGKPLSVALRGVLFVLTVFGCVLLHEFGHALTAKRYGIQTHDITMLPIGGVARLERMPREPRQELLVAAAGPAVNLVIAGLLLVLLMVVYRRIELSDSLNTRGSFWLHLLIANFVLVVFNLIPAFPMDGGRMLRALLATKLDYARATTIAARIGQTLAVGFVLSGLFLVSPPNPMLVLVGAFVFIGAEAESRMVQITSVLSGVRVSEAMMTKFRTLSPDDTLQTAARELLAGAQHDFPVTAGNGVLGLLTRHDLVKGLTEYGPDARVGDVMRSDCGQVSETDLVEKTYETLRQQNCSSLPVVRSGELVGMITLENITEWVMLNNAVRSGK